MTAHVIIFAALMAAPPHVPSVYRDADIGFSVEFTGPYTVGKVVPTNAETVRSNAYSIMSTTNTSKTTMRFELVGIEVVDEVKPGGLQLLNCKDLSYLSAKALAREKLSCDGDLRSDGVVELAPGLFTAALDAYGCVEKQGHLTTRIRSTCDARKPGRVVSVVMAAVSSDGDDTAAARFMLSATVPGGIHPTPQPCRLKEVLRALTTVDDPAMLAILAAAGTAEACGDVLPGSVRVTLHSTRMVDGSQAATMAAAALGDAPLFSQAVCPDMEAQLATAFRTADALEGKARRVRVAQSLYQGCNFRKQGLFSPEEFARAAESATPWGLTLLAVPLHRRLVDRGVDAKTARALVRVMTGTEKPNPAWAR